MPGFQSGSGGQLPTSWGTGNRRLIQDVVGVNNVVGGIPQGQNIYCAEWRDGRNERQSSNSNDAGTMRFLFDDDSWIDPVRARIIRDSFIGGYCGDGIKRTPFAHPYRPGLFCKDIIDVQPMSSNVQPSPSGNNQKSQFLKFNVDLVTFSFESLSYGVDIPYTQSDDYNPNWIEIENRPAGIRTQIPLGWYVFSSGTFQGVASLLGAFQTMPTTILILTIHQVPWSSVFTSGALSLYPFFMPFLGSVNKNSFAGWGAEKLLFDSAEIRPYSNAFKDRLCDVRLILHASDWGWNSSLDPGGSVTPIQFVGIGATLKPFTTFGLGTMMAALNPK